MFLDKGVDPGNIIEISSLSIQQNETAQTLYKMFNRSIKIV